MIEKLLDSLRTMRKRGTFLTVLGAGLGLWSFFNRRLDLQALPMEVFFVIAIVFLIYGLILAVHNTNAIAPMIFSFRYTKNRIFPKKEQPGEEGGPPVGFHYELYSDYLADRRKWPGMAASFFLAAVYFLLSVATLPLIL